MTTEVVNDKKKGAKEILNFVNSFQTTPTNDAVKIRRQRLIKYPIKYEPPALAGSAKDSPLDLTEIRKGWKKR